MFAMQAAGAIRAVARKIMRVRPNVPVQLPRQIFRYLHRIDQIARRVKECAAIGQHLAVWLIIAICAALYKIHIVAGIQLHDAVAPMQRVLADLILRHREVDLAVQRRNRRTDRELNIRRIVTV